MYTKDFRRRLDGIAVVDDKQPTFEETAGRTSLMNSAEETRNAPALFALRGGKRNLVEGGT